MMSGRTSAPKFGGGMTAVGRVASSPSPAPSMGGGGVSYTSGGSGSQGGVSYGSGGGGGGGVAYNPPPSAPAPATAAPVQMTGLPNNAQRDPDMTAFMQQMRGRIGQQMGREGQADPNLQTQIDRLGQRLSTDTTQRAQDFAAQDIGSRARASSEGLEEEMARRGIRGGIQNELSTRLRETGLRESARSAAGIALGREAQLDQLVLGGQGIMAAPGQMAFAREGMTNDLLGAGFGQAGAIAGQNLADRTLGVNQWGEQNRFNLGAASLAQTGRDAEIARLMALTRMGGY